jgi:tetratricopeptide (TPR) repeat protein
MTQSVTNGASTHTDQPKADNLLDIGREALARGDWQEARACFEAALHERETAAALDGLGMAAWWLNDAAATFDARQRAYRLYAAQGQARSAARLARALGDVDLEMAALAGEGLGLVSLGKVHEGMRRLDEATLAAIAGEMSDIDAACTACCSLIFACEWTRDYERAAQWIERLRELATRWSHPSLLAFCRIHSVSVATPCCL